MYCTFLALNTLVNMDHGSIPAATNEISSDFSLSKLQLGALGSLVFIGSAVGGLFAGFTYKRHHAKTVQLVSMILIVFLLFSFPFTSSTVALVYVCRFLTGFCQVFLLVFYPVWVDVFAPPERSTL